MFLQFARPFWMSFWMGDDDEHMGAFAKEAKHNLALLEAQLKGRTFFGGDAVGFLDIAACCLAHWVGVMEEVTGVTLLNKEEFPVFCNWANAYINDDTEAVLAEQR